MTGHCGTAAADQPGDYETVRARIAARFTSEKDIPKAIFSDPDVYREEMKRIFGGKYWHMVAHRAELPEPNSFKTFWLGETPILLTRGEDDTLRAFINTCTHRGTLLEQRPTGCGKEFECPYHRWLFNNQGRFLGGPGRRDFRADFNENDYALPELRVEEFAGLIFCTAAAEVSLEDWLGSCASHVRDVMMDDGRLTLLGYQNAIFSANWKTYFDNDFYHAPLLHMGFRLLSWHGGQGEVRVEEPVGHFSVGYESSPYVDNGFLSDPTLVEMKGTDSRARVVALRPAYVLTKHLDTISVRFVRPLGVDKTEVIYAFFGHESDSPDYRAHRVRQASNLLGPSGMITIEDAAVFNRQQKTSRDGGLSRFVVGVDRPAAEARQNDENGNTAGWAYYREVMGFDH